VRRIMSKEFIIVLLILWMANCASEEINLEEGLPQKEKSTKEVDLTPRPTRSKK
jgi:hypothetical protein